MGAPEGLRFEEPPSSWHFSELNRSLTLRVVCAIVLSIVQPMSSSTQSGILYILKELGVPEGHNMEGRHDRNLWYDNCTIAGATGSASSGGHSLIGSNSDDPFTTRTRLVVVAQPTGYKFIATQIVSQNQDTVVDFNLMHTRGVNDQGFAYTWAGVRPNPDREPDSHQAYGVPFFQFGSLLLGQARTVEDAIGLLDTYPRAIHGNFLFADAVGEMSLVEVSTQSLNIETRTSDGWVGRSNHWVSPEMAGIGYTPEADDSTVVRYARITTLMAEGARRIDHSYLATCFGDHATLEESGWSICAHGHKQMAPHEGRGGTVSSEILEPSLRTMHYAYGWPCGGPVDYPEEQPLQDRSWGRYVTFHLDDLEPGEYVTVDGRLTPQAVGYLAERSGNGVASS